MSNAPVLRLPNFIKLFIVETDASGTGMGVMLQQKGHPIAFISKDFGPRTRGLSVYEREQLAITFVVAKWRHYLEHGLFFIKQTMRVSSICSNNNCTLTYNFREFLNCWG